MTERGNMDAKRVKFDGDKKISMSNYEIHKQLYAQSSPMLLKTIEARLQSVNGWLKSEYYCLMCRERYDFTFFRLLKNSDKKMSNELLDVLDGRGIIYDIRYNKDNDAYECWVKANDGEMYMYLLFDCSFMVVEV
jgi:hypothetical protein